MKASDVRIGNICQHKISSETIGRECIIDAADIVAIVQFEHASKKSPYHAIPLTDEWLLKLGFEEKTGDAPAIGDYNWFEKGIYSTIHIFTGMYGLDGVDCKPIMYVHQMQNLYFALTGEELSYKP